MISNRYLVFLVFIQLNIGRFFAQGNETMTLNKSNRQIDDMIKFIKKKDYCSYIPCRAPSECENIANRFVCHCPAVCVYYCIKRAIKRVLLWNFNWNIGCKRRSLWAKINGRWQHVSEQSVLERRYL